MVLTIILGALTLLSLVLLFWQLIAALRFPLHRRIDDRSFANGKAGCPQPAVQLLDSARRAEDSAPCPTVRLLKPLKGFDQYTADSLRSWFEQSYSGCVQIYFGVADTDDPVCEIVRALLRHFPNVNGELVVCPERLGPNAKVSILIQLERHARAVKSGEAAYRPPRPSTAGKPPLRSDLLVISDADVRVPPDFLANAVAPLQDPSVGLVNCFYQLANPTTLAMRWEAIAINADFWSQVLQSNTIKPQDFALGAVMVTTCQHLDSIGGFESLADYLADDYQFGNRIARTGARIELCPVVVECWEAPMNFQQVWAHQLRWARTIRVSQPAPYFISVLSNVTLWATLLVLFGNAGGFPLVPEPFYHEVPLPWTRSAVASLYIPWVLVVFAVCLTLRAAVANVLQARLTRDRSTSRYWWLTFAKDILQFGIWLAAFFGNTITWRGQKFRLQRDGRLRSK